MSRQSRLYLVIALVLAVSLLVGVLAAATSLFGGTGSPSTVPVLGSRSFAQPAGVGWGTVEPLEIFNGGDPSGMVVAIDWTGWGTAVAYGYGESSIYEPTGGYFPGLVKVELRATTLGHCTAGGPVAYEDLVIREPTRPGGPLGQWSPWGGSGTTCRAGS